MEDAGLIETISMDKVGAVGVFILALVAMILIFCYKTYINSKKQ